MCTNDANIEIKKETKILKINFIGFFQPQHFFFALPVIYLGEIFKACLESFWTKYRLKTPLRQAAYRKCGWGGGGGGLN